MSLDPAHNKIRSGPCTTKKQGKIQRALFASQLFSAMPPLEVVKALVSINDVCELVRQRETIEVETLRNQLEGFCEKCGVEWERAAHGSRWIHCCHGFFFSLSNHVVGSLSLRHDVLEASLPSWARLQWQACTEMGEDVGLPRCAEGRGGRGGYRGPGGRDP